jgi:hypothetical protein
MKMHICKGHLCEENHYETLPRLLLAVGTQTDLYPSFVSQNSIENKLFTIISLK